MVAVDKLVEAELMARLDQKPLCDDGLKEAQAPPE
jgi:hypothetical protein